MKVLIIFTILFISCLNLSAQRLVFDRLHFISVTENSAVRLAAENTHNQYLDKINDNLQTINLNVGSVVLAQTMIYNGLSNVNSALKNGLALKDLSVIVAEILRYNQQTINMARSEPWLFLFTEEYGREISGRANRLVLDVSQTILKEGDNMLANYNSRDQLLKHIRRELQIISGLAYGAWKAVFWAKERGIIRSLNPYADFISKDKRFVEEIIRDARYLRR